MINKITIASCIAAGVTAGVLLGCGGGGGADFGGIANAGPTASDTFLGAISGLIASSSTDDALVVSIDTFAVTTPEDTEPVMVIVM